MQQIVRCMFSDLNEKKEERVRNFERKATSITQYVDIIAKKLPPLAVDFPMNYTT